MHSPASGFRKGCFPLEIEVIQGGRSPKNLSRFTGRSFKKGRFRKRVGLATVPRERGNRALVIVL